MDKHEVARRGILNIQVCSSGTIEEALEWVRNEEPAGTTANWGIDDDPRVAPVQCDDHADRKHYVFVC